MKRLELTILAAVALALTPILPAAAAAPRTASVQGSGVGRLGIEPRTRGLKVRCSAS